MNKYRLLVNTPGFLPYDPNIINIMERFINFFPAPRGCGKSTFLQFLKLYYDKKEDASDLFVDDIYHMNKHVVLYLDFSDFSATSYEEALHYLKMKISELYSMHMDIIEECHSSYCFDALEGELSEEMLEKALDLINWDPDEPYQKPLILIDDFTLPLVWSLKHGYYEQMNSLLFKMIRIDAYERNLAIVLTGDILNGKGIPFPLPRWILVHEPNHLPHASELYKRNTSEELIVLNKYDSPSKPINDAKMIDSLMHASKPYTYSITEELLAKTRQMRIDLDIYLEQEEKKRIEKDRRIREDKAYILPDDCLRLSPHCGAHGYPIGNDPQCLNTLLQDIYRNVDFTDEDNIYDYVLQIDESTKTDYGKISSRGLYDKSSCFWKEYAYSKSNDYSCFQWIKITVSVKDRTHIASFFNNALDYLLENAAESFHVKAAKTARMDNIHFWIDRNDFFAFEEYLNKYQDLLEDTLPFHAHRGKLGISREYLQLSHNSIFATMASIYLQRVSSLDEISFTAMIDTFVKAWTMELEGYDKSRRFDYFPVLDIIIPLETADVLTGKTSLHDDHFLLSNDRKTFSLLRDCHDWKHYEEEIKEW